MGRGLLEFYWNFMVFALSSDWFIVFVFIVIGQSDHL